MDRDTQGEKAEAFRRLHAGPRILVLPNAWDVASARILEEAGFPAIATTSSGIAHARGYPDGERIGRDLMLEAIRRIATAVDVPVSADIEAGYGPSPEDVAETVRGAIEAGAIGVNLEDGTGRANDPLFALPLAVLRVRAAREAAEAAGVPLVINARTDGYWAGVGEGAAVFAMSVERANAYRRAGADCLFVPAVTDRETIGALVTAIDGPLNVLASPATPPAPELRALGVARVSIGGSLARATLALVRRAARELLGPGTFTFAGDAVAYREMNALLDRRSEGDGRVRISPPG